MLSVYAPLDHGARSWWYHQQLRKDGREIEARKLERQTIRNGLRSIRALADCEGCIVWGHGSIHYSTGNVRASNVGHSFVTAAVRAGLPLIDMTRVQEINSRQVAVSVWGPVFDGDRNQSPKLEGEYWGACDSAPLWLFASLHWWAGAHVLGLPRGVLRDPWTLTPFVSPKLAAMLKDEPAPWGCCTGCEVSA